jgi:phosphopentomutase
MTNIEVTALIKVFTEHQNSFGALIRHIETEAKEGDSFATWNIVKFFCMLVESHGKTFPGIYDVAPRWFVAEMLRIADGITNLTDPQNDQKYSGTAFAQEITNILRINGNVKRRTSQKRVQAIIRAEVRRLMRGGIMKREKLIAEVSRRYGLSRRPAEAIVDSARRTWGKTTSGSH